MIKCISGVKRKDKIFWYWVDIFFKIFVFIAAVVAMKLVFFK